MSRKWNIKCTVCADPKKPVHLDEAILKLGEGSNHNEPAAVAVAKAAAALAALGKAVPAAQVSAGSFGLSWGYGDVHAAWFAVHEGHKLVVVDEFGELSDDYWPEAEVFRCQSMKPFRGQGIEQCGLPVDHGGIHSSGARTWEESYGINPVLERLIQHPNGRCTGMVGGLRCLLIPDHPGEHEAHSYAAWRTKTLLERP